MRIGPSGSYGPHASFCFTKIAPRRHPGGTLEAPGSTQEAPGGTQEASRRHLEASWRHTGRTLGGRDPSRLRQHAQRVVKYSSVGGKQATLKQYCCRIQGYQAVSYQATGLTMVTRLKGCNPRLSAHILSKNFPSQPGGPTRGPADIYIF